MSSETSICNIALGLAGAKLIQNYDTEETTEARRCRQFYDPARDFVLSAHPWDFAEARVAMSLLSDETVYGYDYGYTIPSDCLKMRAIYNATPNQAPITFKRMMNTARTGNICATDEEDAILIYTVKVSDTNVFSAAFRTALAWKLASDLAIPLTKDSNKQKSLLSGYFAYVASVEGIDADEGEIDTEVDSEFLTYRL